MATLFVDKVDPQSGTSLEIGSSGDTITIPSGCTITNNGTQSGFGGANTPYFYARLGSNQTGVTNDTNTKVQFNTEDFDTGNEYDNSSNYRFTPANGNTYLIHAQLKIGGSSNTTLQEAKIQLYKNGSEVFEMRDDSYNNSVNKASPSLSKMVTGNGSDYYEIYGRAYLTSGTVTFFSSSFFTAFKLIS